MRIKIHFFCSRVKRLNSRWVICGFVTFVGFSFFSFSLCLKDVFSCGGIFMFFLSLYTRPFSCIFFLLLLIRTFQLLFFCLKDVFSLFYKYTTDITYITKSGRKKNKLTYTLIRSKHKKGEVFGTFLTFLCICGSVTITSVYPRKTSTLLYATLTHSLSLTGPASGSTGPNSSSAAASL